MELRLLLNGWNQVALLGEMVLSIDDDLGNARVPPQFVRVLLQKFVGFFVSALCNAVLKGLWLHHVLAVDGGLLLLWVGPLLLRGWLVLLGDVPKHYCGRLSTHLTPGLRWFFRLLRRFVCLCLLGESGLAIGR